MIPGAAGFVVGLAQKSALIKEVFSPIMGTAILIAIVTYTLRLQTAASRADLFSSIENVLREIA